MTVTKTLSQYLPLKFFTIAAISLCLLPLTLSAKDKEKPSTKDSKSAKTVVDEKPEDEKSEDEKETAPPVALPVSSDPKQIYGWKEDVLIKGLKHPLLAKLDTGARTSSMHAESQTIFERNGDKWVRFKTSAETTTGMKSFQLEAPLTKTTLIKVPNGESVRRNVVRLTFTVGERQLRSEFTLNNRSNMICPVLIGRTAIKPLGWIDADRTHLAEKKILR